MSELVADMEDWSLQAIVRGSSGDFGKIDAMNMDMDGPDSFLHSLTTNHHHRFDHDLYAGFPDIFEGSGDELEDLYKPFYPAMTSSSSLSLPDQTVNLDFQELNFAKDKPQPPSHDVDQSSASSAPVASVVAAVYTPKYKKRKNQHKRVVVQVSAEGLSSDMWAWRKYGQKPIKGSPYPRSYYRCSSSKGCLARKQVEQSCTDEGMFIITYTAEHNHSQPTRRNSLAGTVRQKFPSPKSPRSSTTTVKQEMIKSTSKAENNNEVLMVSSSRILIKQEMNKEEEVEKACDDEYIMSDFVFNEDFFSGLEEFDEFVSSSSSKQQFPVRPCSWV